MERHSRKGPCTIDELGKLLAIVQQTAPRHYPMVTDLLSRLPIWLRALGTPPGIDDFQRRRDVTIPAALRMYFAHPVAACWLQLYADTDTFLDDPSFLNPPPLLRWSHERYIVIGHFGHSNTVIAVEVDSNDPLVGWGYDSRKFDELPPLTFSTWLSGIAKQIITGPDAS